MSQPMLSLGGFNFSVDTATYDSLSRNYGWRWQAQPRVGKRDILQYTGQEAPTISINGSIATAYRSVGTQQIQKLVTLANKGQPLLMMSGEGDKLGYWGVKRIQQTDRRFISGGSPRFQDFSMELIFYGDDLQDA
ncbi:phage tail protein [Celerinatantimonas sp. MCCC 1A17872]|uniref:phage tail protein n=1 Tax=Celerinatantimonas sp. MCCC 1A17872 TaxID=3177514 RepID=UPI0038C1B177